VHETAERERRAACTLVDGNARLVAYLRRVNARAQGLHAELRRLENEREVRAGSLADRHLELKRLEVLAERRSERRRAARMRTEQQAIDELVLIRRHLRAPG
jgi:flagellar export protein FliJ